MPQVSKRWLETAERIGQTLCKSAVREGGRCSWIGRSLAEATIPQTIVAVVEALGPELYDGTAGIALFLGRLHAVTGDLTTKQIAREAIEHALTESQRAESIHGLHTGLSSIAFAAANLGLLLDDPGLETRARQLMVDVSDAPLDSAPPDLLGGIAGTAAVYLAWPKLLRRENDLELAVQLGNAVADAATRRGDTWAWPQSGSGTQPLTGLSHGAAGMGVVLLELHRRTGIERFREIGEGAFAYEDRYFDIATSNWPDFRPDATAAFSEQPFGHGWCHGAPGIALARRHALSHGSRPVWQRDWELALATCGRAARELFEPGSDSTLCHGLAGCVEPLLEAQRSDVLAIVWGPQLDRFSENNTWPSGLPSRGPNPSLMLGTAGIGYTMLRMHDPTTPSVLLPLLGAPR